MHYNFEWDPVKARTNYQKHRINFERASEVFLDPFALSVFDEEHEAIEERWITLGVDRNDVPIVVVHTFKEIDPNNSCIRIISARKATKKETKQYHTR